MYRKVPIAWCIAWAVAGFAGASAPPPFDALFDPGLRPRVREVSFSPDGRWLVYREETEAGPLLRFIEISTGRVTRELPLASFQVAGEPGSLALESFSWLPDGRRLWRMQKDLYLEPLQGSALVRLTHTPEAGEEHVTPAPDGKRLAFSRGGNLFTLDLSTGKETQYSTDGDGDGILNGTTDWVYWEEIWNRSAQAIWWAPDGKRLAFYRFDGRQVERFPLLDERTPYPKIRWQRYPKAGTRNPAVEVLVLDLSDGRAVRLETGDPEAYYLARIHWHPDAQSVAVERLNRDQTELDLLLCQARDGSCRVLTSQRSETWVNLGEEFRFLPDGSFLWANEDTGWRRLVRYDREGRKIAFVSPEGWQVTEVLGLFSEPTPTHVACQAFRTEGLGAAERRILWISLGDGSFRVLDDRPGWHGATFETTGNFYVHDLSRSGLPPQRALRHREGKILFELPASIVLPSALAALPEPKLLTIPGPGGVKLPAQLLLPAALEPGRRYPVLMYHYGGPGSQVVADRYDPRRGLWHRWMAARGYAVVQVDNPASLFFGKSGEDRVHRRFGPLELEAQLAAVEWLRQQPWADATRIGLWGWSGGGYHTLYALTHAPGIWKAGVAGAPVTDWSYYDTIWTERYLDLPAENPEGYRAASILEAADKLQDFLLLVHGTGDDNVHPQNTVALLDRLIRLGKRHEVALYPGELHGFSPPAWRHALERMTAFFDRHLQPTLSR